MSQAMPLVLDFLVIPPIVGDDEIRLVNIQDPNIFLCEYCKRPGVKKCGIRPQSGSNSCKSVITANLFIITLAIVKKGLEETQSHMCYKWGLSIRSTSECHQ